MDKDLIFVIATLVSSWGVLAIAGNFFPILKEPMSVFEIPLLLVFIAFMGGIVLGIWTLFLRVGAGR